MKLLHTADWHIGKYLSNVSRIEEQRKVLAEICRIADEQDVDAVLIAGDVFDKSNPSHEAEDLFYETIHMLSDSGRRSVVVIAGNHDSPYGIETSDPLARACGIVLAGYPNTLVEPCKTSRGLEIINSECGFIELKLPNVKAPLRLLLTPYASEHTLKRYLGSDNPEEEMRQVLQHRWNELAEKYCDDKGVNVLLAHLYVMKKGGEAPPEPEDEKPILHIGGAQVIYTQNIPKQIQYVALGHLHRYQVIDAKPCPVVYCSSPLSYSFSEAGQQKYVVVIDAESGKPVVCNKVELHEGKPLLRLKCDGIDEAVAMLQKSENALVELKIVMDHYPTADERKRLNDAHQNIITLLHESHIQLGGSTDAPVTVEIDLSESVDELFKKYFTQMKGSEAPEDLLSLFKEVQATEIDS